MNDTPLPPEITKAVNKFAERENYKVKAEGYGAETSAQLLAQKCLGELAQAIKDYLAKRGQKHSAKHRRLVANIRALGPKKSALCILQSALHSIGKRDNSYIKTPKYIGEQICAECWANGLTGKYGKRGKRVESIVDKHVKRFAKKIAKSARKKPNISQRWESVHKAAEKLDYATQKWNDRELFHAGYWALGLLCNSLPNTFKLQGAGPTSYLTLTQEAEEYTVSLIEQIILSKPVWLPSAEAPPPWTAWNKGGTSDPRLAPYLFVMKPHHEDADKAVKAAIADGSMRPALSALSALQSVQWKINERVLEVIRECERQKVEVEGMPSPKVRKHVLFEETLKTAEEMCLHSRFYTPMYFDWRGRVYAAPSFNFAREDYVRSLFLFANGEPIGEEGIYWLKVHLANRGEFGKINKQPFQERVAWVDAGIERIIEVAKAPLENLWWTKAECPFQFLAACIALSEAHAQGPDYVCRLPVAFDGSCNGLQHLCAMTRAEEEGALVNLVDQQTPQDIYEEVAKQAEIQIRADVENGDQDTRELARACVSYIWDKKETSRPRKVFKGNTMTYFYGSERYGMAEQQFETLGKLKDHPFKTYKRRKAASKYLAKHALTAVEARIKRPVSVMKFLQELAQVLATENIPAKWETPVGIPWANCYYKPKWKKELLYLHNFGVKAKTVKLAVGYGDEIRKAKARNGVAPNFVHALDAAHLMLTVNAAVAEGITNIATVHDSYSCLPSRAARFREIIREQFAGMYEKHDDVLREVWEQAFADLSDPNNKLKLPKVPSKGSLDIEAVLEAQFAFA